MACHLLFWKRKWKSIISRSKTVEEKNEIAVVNGKILICFKNWRLMLYVVKKPWWLCNEGVCTRFYYYDVIVSSVKTVTMLTLSALGNLIFTKWFRLMIAEFR